MTPTTKIAGEAMTDEQIIEMASRFAHSDGWLNGDGAIAFARALLASKPAVPWIAHWAGSNPYKGWSIRCGRDEIVWFGETVSSETVESIVLAHNKCFDCDGTGCVMNCSGLRSPAPASPGGEDAAEQADEAVTDAAISACALMIKGICMTKSPGEWTKSIEERIRFMLKGACK